MVKALWRVIILVAHSRFGCHGPPCQRSRLGVPCAQVMAFEFMTLRPGFEAGDDPWCHFSTHAEQGVNGRVNFIGTSFETEFLGV